MQTTKNLIRRKFTQKKEISINCFLRNLMKIWMSKTQKQDDLKKKNKTELRTSLTAIKTSTSRGTKRTHNYRITEKNTESINKLETAGNRWGKPEKKKSEWLYAHLLRWHQTWIRTNSKECRVLRTANTGINIKPTSSH